MTRFSTHKLRTKFYTIPSLLSEGIPHNQKCDPASLCLFFRNSLLGVRWIVAGMAERKLLYKDRLRIAAQLTITSVLDLITHVPLRPFILNECGRIDMYT